MNKTFKIITGIAFVLSCALFSASFVSAQTTTPAACLGAAVAVRESSLDAGMTIYTQALNAAYAARATALETAYAQTDGNKSVHTSIKSAWAVFAASMKDSRNTWRFARNAAWTTFSSSTKSCKALQSISDQDHSIQEVSGN